MKQMIMTAGSSSNGGRCRPENDIPQVVSSQENECYSCSRAGNRYTIGYCSTSDCTVVSGSRSDVNLLQTISNNSEAAW